MTTAEKYVTAAYLVVLAVVLLYVVLYSFKLSRLSREIDELAGRARESPSRPHPLPTRSDADPARVARK